MRRYLSLVLVLVVLVTPGCIEEYTPETNGTPAQTPGTSPVLTGTPPPTPTPAPAELAYLAGVTCSLDSTTERTYHCNGNVRVRTGYNEVQVISRYPDNNTFSSAIVSMGGTNPVSRPFVLFPDLKYQGQEPQYFVRLDNAIHPVIMTGTNGIAWAHLPP